MSTRDVERTSRMHGEVSVPGDKSASHRALMISALSPGESVIEGLSPGEDVSSTARILESLGAGRSVVDGRTVVVGPPDGLTPSRQPLDCGNSGTTMRLMAGIVSAVPGEHLLVGDDSLSRRPMDRVAVPLTLMGSKIRGQGDRQCAPLSITGTRPLRAISYAVPTASAQVKSSVLLAGLFGDGPTEVHETIRTRTATEDMLRMAGVDVASKDVGAGRVVRILPGRPRATSWHVPGDPSQAAFFCVLGLVHGDAHIVIRSIDAAPERIGFVNVLRRMGGAIDLVTTGEASRLTARSSSLQGTDIFAEEIPSVDEVPILAVAAAAASGVTTFRNMGELRLKESDRFAGSMALATALGCRVHADGDDFSVHGLGSAEKFLHFTFDAGLDHRMVMSSAVAGTAGNGCTIAGVATVASSYPNFFADLDSLR